MKRIIAFLLALFLFAVGFSACSPHKDGIVFMVNGEAMLRIKTNKEGGTVTISAPNSVNASACVGWVATVGDNTVFLPVGGTYTYEKDENTVFNPLYLTATTEEKVTLLYGEGDRGLRFTTTFSAAEYTALLEVAKSVSCGTLLVKKAEVDETVLHGFTHAHLDMLGVAGADVAATISEGAEGKHSFVSLFESPAENYKDFYIAQGYFKITYSDGTEKYFYAGAEEKGLPCSSMRQAASAVLGNLKSEDWLALSESERETIRAYGASSRVLITKTGSDPEDIRPDLSQYNAVVLKESDESVQWRQIMNLLPLHHSAAMYITAKDGFVLSHLSVSEVVYENGEPLSSTRYAIRYYHGALIISWSNYSLPV